MPRWRSAALGVLWTAGILCVFPQGLVPIGFNLLGADPQVKVRFVARYLEEDPQIPVAAGFVAAGLLAIGLAASIRRSR